MGSLSRCLNKAGLEKHETAILKGAAADYLSEGKEAHQAAVTAVLDHIEDLLAERSDIARQAKEQGGEVGEPSFSMDDARAIVAVVSPSKGVEPPVKAVEKIAEEAPKNQPTPPDQSAKIGDFGNKIGGAKKDLWATYDHKMKQAEGMDVSVEPLSKSWPEPDYQGLLDSGADPFSVAFIRASREEIPRKPTVGWKLKGWVAGVTIMRDTANKLLGGELSASAASEKLAEAAKTSRGMQDVAGRIELYMLVGHSQSLAGVKLSRGEYSLYKGVEYKPSKILWTVSKQDSNTRFSNWPRELVVADSKTDALRQFKERFDALVITKPKDVAATFDIFSQGSAKGYFIGKKVGRNVITLAGPFDTIKEARAYRESENDDLIAKLEKSKEIPKLRRESNEPRVGEDMRDGQDVTAERFADSFGFNAVEFGNWVEQKKRQKDLNESFDALMDMAAILGVPPRALSLNGELGLAFGARGSGGIDPAVAHYEADYVAINLTKKEGAGSLGHEWWHALDSYFSRMRGKSAENMTEASDVSLASRKSEYLHRGAVRKEMVDAFGLVIGAIRATALKERSAKLDSKRSKEYWTTGREMSARAFESYLISKLQDQNASNDYLANIVDPATWKAAESLGFELGDSYPYPTAGEVPVIRAAFDKFFSVVETKEEDGRVAMFSRNDIPSMQDIGKVGSWNKEVGFSPIPAKDMVRVFKAFSKFRKNGISRELLSKVKQVTGVVYPDDRVAGFNPKLGRMSVGKDLFAMGDEQFVHVIGHELGHASDMVIEAEITAAALSSHPDMSGVLGECLEAYNNGGYREEFVYPLDGMVFRDAPSDFLRQELFAQLVGIYASDRAVLESGLPISYSFIERAINEPNSISKETAGKRDEAWPFAWSLDPSADGAFYRFTPRSGRDGRVRSGAGLDSVEGGRKSGSVDDVADKLSRAVPNESRIAAADLAAVVATFRKGFSGVPVVTVERESQLPDALQQEINEADANGEVAGAFHRGSIYLVRDNLRSIEHAEDTALHEAEHAGLSKMFGTSLNPVMLDVWKSNLKVQLAAKKIKDKYGYSQVRSIEEMLAEMGPGAKSLKGWPALVSWVRAKLRKMGFVKEWTDQDVEALVLRALASLKSKGATSIYSGSALSRSENDGLNFVNEFLTELSYEDAAFRYPASKSLTLEGNIAEALPGSKYLGEDTRPDEREESLADHRFVFSVPNKRRFYVYTKGKEVWIDVSRLYPGDQGGAVYHGIANYAHNAGKVFVGDPHGLSEEAIVRRTSAMLSSALRFGTVAHFDAARQQIAGVPEKGIEPLDWRGDDVAKTKALIHTFISTLHNQFPAIKNYHYDFINQQFRDAAGGRVSYERLVEGASGRDSRASRAGEASLRRGILIQSLASSESGERPGLLELVLSRSVQLAGSRDGLKAVFSRHESGARADGNARFSRIVGGAITSQPINQSWKDPDNLGPWDDFVRVMQDKLVDTKRVISTIRKAGVSLKDNVDPYLQEVLYHGRSAKRVSDFADNELRPMLVEMSLRQIDRQDFEDYLWARHATERNAQIAKINPSMPDSGSGLSNQQAADILADRPVTIGGREIKLDPAKKGGYQSLAAKIDAITKETTSLLVRYGLETQDTVDAWRATYGKYVPLMRDMAADDNYAGAFGLGIGTGQGFSVRGSSAKRAMGSEKGVIDILANVAMQRERAIVRGEKNRVAQAMYGLAVTAPNPDFWIPINPAANKSPQSVISELVALGINPADAENIANEPTQRYIDPKTGLVMDRINPQLRTRGDVLAVRINGADRFVMFSSDARAQKMVAGLKNLDAEQLGLVLQKIAVVTRWFSAINTQFNPVFGLTNGVRDLGTGMLNLSSTEIKGHQAEVFKNSFSALRGIYSDLRERRAGHPPTSHWALSFEEFALEGGQTGYRDMFQTSKERTDALMAELKDATKGKTLLTFSERRSPLFGWLSDYNTAIENAVRLSAYQAAKDKGLSKQKAASLAKNLTVNFNKKGLAATQLGAMYAFFNAAAQGTARIGQTMVADTNGKPSLTVAGKKILYGGMMAGVLQAAMLAAAGYDDKDPPQFVREKSFVIPLPDGKYFSVPYPMGFHIIPNIGRIAAEFALGGFKSPGQRMLDMFTMIIDGFNPIGGSSGGISQMLSPTITDPLVALSENKDWTGKSIFKDDFNKMRPTAGWTRKKDSASVASKWLAYGINYITGGGKYEIGLLSPTPDQLDYLIGQGTGGVGRETLKAWQFGATAASGEEMPMYKIPVVGRFVGETTGQYSETSKFYNSIERIGEHKSALDEMAEAHDLPAMTRYRRDNPDAALVKQADHASADIGKLKRRKRELLESNASADHIKLIDMQITARVKRYNKQLSAGEAR